MAGWDTVAAPVCLLLAVAVRLGTATPWETCVPLDYLILALIAPPMFWSFGLYREITRYIGPRYIWLLLKSCVAVGVAFALCMFFMPDRRPALPRTSIPLIAIFLFIVSGGVRVLVRHLLRSSFVPRNRVVICGAGDCGAGLLAALAQDRATVVQAVLDDDPQLIGNVIRGVRVAPMDSIEDVIRDRRVDTVLVAINPSGRAKRAALFERAAAAGARVLAVPTMVELKEGRVDISRLRPIAIEDLLGRAPVVPDPSLVSACVSGRTVLITGAGGSIGSELCRQVLALGPKAMVIVDNCEFGLFQIDTELSRLAADSAPGSTRVALHRYLASVTDAVIIDQIIGRHKPETIYHAAAYKHVPIVEDNESVGAEVNVLGTLRVAEAALKHGVRDLVFVSTDKAVRPTSVMGCTKRLAEMVLQAMQSEFGKRTGITFTMVRFGNVLGSSGSVVPIFQRQIAAGGPVTVTHPDVTRYFMTIKEAVQLILQAGAMGDGGDVFVLDMGEPVKITDLARNLISLAGRSVKDEKSPDGDIEIVYSGLRPGEKLFEELVIGAKLIPTRHPMLLRAVEHFEPWSHLEHMLQQLEALASQHDREGVRQLLLRAVGATEAKQRPRDQVS